jgi:TolB protein
MDRSNDAPAGDLTAFPAAALDAAPTRRRRWFVATIARVAAALLLAAAEASRASAGDALRWDLVYERATAGRSSLHLAPAGGGPERSLTDGASSDRGPRFTRDGGHILFFSDRSGNIQLWEMPSEGGRPVRLRTNDSTDWQADESPDGRQIALLSKVDGAEALYVLDRASGRARTLVRHGRNMKGGRSVLGNPNWSPDGKSIVFSSNVSFGHQIYVVDVATSRETQISPTTSGGCEPRFSPDGRKVVYVSRRLWRVRSRIVEHELQGGAERDLVDWDALNYDPAYSPDASEIAFASTREGPYAIYRLRLKDGRFWRVTTGPGDARNPDYRPVGDH